MTTGTQALTPEERAFRTHVAGGRFRSGTGRGHWRLVEADLAWPNVLIAVSAAPREGAPTEFFLKFDLSGYPTAAPTAGAWHPTEHRWLTAAERPKGGRAEKAFRADWREGQALYIPGDRLAIGGHENWAGQSPGWAWDPTEGITRYLRHVHTLLNEDEYRGV